MNGLGGAVDVEGLTTGGGAGVAAGAALVGGVAEGGAVVVGAVVVGAVGGAVVCASAPEAKNGALKSAPATRPRIFITKKNLTATPPAPNQASLRLTSHATVPRFAQRLSCGGRWSPPNR
jgi:hypothetical protein